MNDLHPVGTPEELEEYRRWREAQAQAARQRAKAEGDQPPRLTSTDEAALDRTWEFLVEEEAAAEKIAA